MDVRVVAMAEMNVHCVRSVRGLRGVASRGCAGRGVGREDGVGG